MSTGYWWLRSPNANNTNNAGLVNNNGNVNNNNVNNDWAARPASPYRPKYAAGASYLCRLFSVCLHKAKEPYSLSRRSVKRSRRGKTHTAGAAGRRRGRPQGRPGRTLSDSLKEPPVMAFETLFPGGEIRSIVRMTEYEKIYWFDNLYRAYKMAARCKRTKTEVIEFELNLAENLWSLHDALESKRYRPAGYHRFMIYDPKKREIQALSFRDRVVQHSLCDNVLKPYFEKRLIYDCAACWENKGTHFAMDRLSGFLREFYKAHGTKGYFLKCDVRKYFDSIDHNALKYLLRRFPDKEVLTFLYQIIDSFNADTGKGLPMGNQSSQWFALYYLNQIDRIIKEKYKIKHYTRYMDDLILLHEDKEHLKTCLAEIRAFAAEKLKLEFNEKTQIFPVSEGVDYLGWRFYLTDTGKVIRRLRTSNKRRFKRRLKAFREKYRNGEMDLDAIKRSLASYNGHLKHGHTWKLKTKIYGNFVLTKAPKGEVTAILGEMPMNA